MLTSTTRAILCVDTAEPWITRRGIEQQDTRLYCCGHRTSVAMETRSRTLKIIVYKTLILLLAGFEVLAAVVMKISVFWDMTPCCPLKVNRCYGWIYRRRVQSWGVSQTRNQYKTGSKTITWCAKVITQYFLCMFMGYCLLKQVIQVTYL
jgi:hypothetical protein